MRHALHSLPWDVGLGAARAERSVCGRDTFRSLAKCAAGAARRYGEKLGCRPEALVKALWGDFAYSAKDKRVVKARARGGAPKPKTMFVQFILEPLWKVRRAVLR